ncbi:VOC family protein [Streptomyces zingiberis]|uniref:VOC family protein n=1 Tax=Streptomyces zingiberis TaxID=2053010 RepID=A0ABX1BVY7_9ACTN|nr:VOC family protein [Streptomyces zingiberis]NJP99901.1 VOC family protein [Streptomyces zingiberis]
MAPFAEGAPCWADAMLPDLEAGKRFYGDLFGWSFGPSEDRFGRYTQAYLGDRAAAALFPKTDGRMPTAWNVYLATPDATALAARIREAGGKLINDPTPVHDYGVMATAADPGGAVFSFWQPGTHQGFEATGEPGAYAWAELRTRDKTAADPFYERVFGYATRDVPGAESSGEDDGGLDFRVWAPAGRTPGEESAVGGRAVMDERFPAELPPHFLVYFAVPDCDEAVATTGRLGGRTTAGPMDTPHGRLATVADDQGAAFAVIALAGR